MTRRRAQNRRNATRRNYCGGRAEKTGELVPPKASRGRAARISGQALFCLRCLARRAYLSPGSRARVRRLRRRKDGIEAIDKNGRLDFRVSKGEEDFLFWGPVVWRGGPLAGTKRCSYKKAQSILSEPSQD